MRRGDAFGSWDRSAPIIGYRKNGSPIYPIRGGASPLQVADASQQRVARRPQTTEQPVAGGPFLRHSRKSRSQMYNVTGQPFGALVNQPLKAVPGFLIGFDICVVGSGGAAAGQNAVASADAPYNVVSQITFKDAFGQVIHSLGGYELAKLVNPYSGQCGWGIYADPANLPSFSNVAVTGNFRYRMFLPLEIFDAFGSLPGANAAATPQLQIQLASAATLYTTPPNTLPTLSVYVEAYYYAIPLDDPSLAPPDNGASAQWIQQTSPTQVPSAAFSELTLPPMGSYLTTLILLFRDSTGARTDAILPGVDNTLELWIDGVPEYVDLDGTRRDWTTRLFGVTRPAGAVIYSYRDAEASFGPITAIDTGDLWLPTTPGSQLTVRGNWGVNANAPGSCTVIAGRVYSPGGIPYTHLAD